MRETFAGLAVLLCNPRQLGQRGAIVVDDAAVVARDGRVVAGREGVARLRHDLVGLPQRDPVLIVGGEHFGERRADFGRVVGHHLGELGFAEIAADGPVGDDVLRYSDGAIVFSDALKSTDAALASFLRASVEIKATVDQIHALSGPSIPPNSSMFVTYFHLATDSVLMFLPWARGEYRHLPPNQRPTFADLVKGWRLGVEKDIARPGRTKKEGGRLMHKR